jgi:hypothetical protein
MTGGFTNNFQMTLGGAYGEGPDFQDKLTASLNNAFRNGDSLSVFGWSTTDMPTGTADWQAGLGYKTQLLRYRRHTLTVGGGMQRWVLPNVKTGAKDWLLSGNLVYGTSVKKIPIFVTEDSWSLTKSTLPKGSAIYTQVYTQHSLLKRPQFQLLLREGPGHSYSWGFYGTHGNRDLRYGGSLVALWKGATIEAGWRHQFGLQDKVHPNQYWSFLVTRQFTKSLKNSVN